MENKPFGYHEKIPDEIRDSFAWLCSEISELTGKWNIYIDFYGAEDSIKLLTFISPSVFLFIQDSLIKDIFMIIGRLNDPIKTFNKYENISLQILIEKCNSIPNFCDKYEQAVEKSNSIEIYRNKFLAHNDLNFVLHPNKNSIPPIIRKDVDKLVKLLGEICNIVYMHYANGDQLMIDPILKSTGKEFIEYLDRLIKSEKELEKIKYGIENK
jgi:hypothetical protein